MLQGIKNDVQWIVIENVRIFDRKLTHWSGVFSFKQIKPKFGDVFTKFKVSTLFQPAIYTVFDEESESEAQNTENLQENLKKNWFQMSKKYMAKSQPPPPVPGPSQICVFIYF